MLRVGQNSIFSAFAQHVPITTPPQLESVEVARVDFLEAHVPDHSAVFHYLVLLQLQVMCSQVPQHTCYSGDPV